MKDKIITASLQIGATIVETVVVIGIIVFISSMLIVNFPKIQKELTLSRAAYTFSQNIRNIQNMALSGNTFNDSLSNVIEPNGYGVYMDLKSFTNQYIVYADVDGDSIYNELSPIYCSKEIISQIDCILSINKVSESDQDIYIKKVNNISGDTTSINFSLPSASVNMNNIMQGSNFVEIVLGSKRDNSIEQKISVNSIGLIEVK